MKVIKYERTETGEVSYVETIEMQEDTQITEEIIANKEAELLAMYNELQELKNNSAE